jgi:hypothetical protein
VHAFVETVRGSRMREICTSGLKRGAEPNGSAPTRLQILVFCFFMVPGW